MPNIITDRAVPNFIERSDHARLPPPGEIVRKVPLNRDGIDYVVGDIHGAYQLVDKALGIAGFVHGRDRLIGLGDLVDRGPDPLGCLPFMAKHLTIRGNHEQAFIDIEHDLDQEDVIGTRREHHIEKMTTKYGMDWWQRISAAYRRELVDAFARLPVAMEIETMHGKVGLVHGEVPMGWDWDTFTAALEVHDRTAVYSAFWGRKRLERGNDEGVPGIARVYCGHSILEATYRLGNVFYLDTGAYKGVVHNRVGLPAGRLTMVRVDAEIQDILAPYTGGDTVDVRRRAPVGAYFTG